MTLPGDTPISHDPCDRRRALRAPDLLQQFNAAGVLEPADVHAAIAAGRLLEEADNEVLLAAALAIRGIRQGYVRIHLPSLRKRQEGIFVEDAVPGELDLLPWPEPPTWLRSVAASPLCGTGDPSHPLVLSGEHLYLQRYWHYEQEIAKTLRKRADMPPLPLDRFQAQLDRIANAPLGPAEGMDPDQVRAARKALTRRLTVVTGGPGSGKTQTVARLLAVLVAVASEAGQPLPVIAVAAPTGKAAAVLKAKIREAADKLPLPGEEARGCLRRVDCSTIHRLLGFGAGRSTFRHGPADLLPYDFVVVDEMSMVPLSLTARLLGAIRPTAQLVLVGDADQLVSIEVGSVLRDMVGPARDAAHTPVEQPAPTEAKKAPRDGVTPAHTSTFGGHVVVLTFDHRAGPEAIKELREAVRKRDVAEVTRLLDERKPGVTWREVSLPRALSRVGPVEHLAEWLSKALPDLARDLADHATALHEMALRGDGARALGRLEKRGFLCAHRSGPYGAATWSRVVEQLVKDRIPDLGRRRGRASRDEDAWYPGRPVMVTANDYGLRLFNGDKGVAVGPSQNLRVAFAKGSEGAGDESPRLLGPAQLENIQTVHALTIHKSQGSEFDEVVVFLPDESSPLLTRQLLYTAITRAKNQVTVTGTRAAIAKAVTTEIARPSGLADLIWGSSS